MPYKTDLSLDELSGEINRLIDEGIRKGKYDTDEEWGDAVEELLTKHQVE